jgi:hypothetical protein
MNIADIRHRNFLLLLDNECGGGRGASRIMADKLGIEPTQLSHLKTRHRNIGDKLARRIESTFKKGEGWMDHTHPAYGIAENAATYIVNTENAGKIPMIRGDQVISYLDNDELLKGTPLIDEPFEHAADIKCFAYKEESTLNSPLLPEGTLYTIQPFDKTKLPCLAAIYINNNVVVGLYDKNPFGAHIIFSDHTKKDLPDDHRFLGRVLEIKPPQYSK